MKRVIFFIFLISFFSSKSQNIISDTVTNINCYHDGSILLEITNVDQFTLEWYYQDNMLGWISTDTMSDIVFNINLDSVLTQRCGNFRLDILNNFSVIVDSRSFWVGCKLGINPSHENVKCFGDSTGELKRIAHSGMPPYIYEWFYNGILISSGSHDTLHENLPVGVYEVFITDSIGCQDSVIATISSPLELYIDSINIGNINCRGENTGSVMYMINGGMRYSDLEYYNYYLISGSDTISSCDTVYCSSSLSSFVNPYQIIFDSLYELVVIAVIILVFLLQPH